MSKKWILRNDFDPELVANLETTLAPNGQHQTSNSYRILSKLMILRGIHSIEQARDFTTFSMDKLHDPFLMDQMDVAVERIDKAIRGQENIMVYGDYDVDGTTSVALLTSFLKPLTTSVTNYIPDRYTEGYGVSYKSIDHAAENGVTLIIALDCGIKAVEKVAYAKEKGIDYIICDHHTPGPVLPDAVAVLDPKKESCTYPYNELSGCAIGYKLCQALTKHFNLNPDKLIPLLDLVAVSVACDIVPITGENRNLMGLGLDLINKNPRPSIARLLGEKHPMKKYNVSDLVFSAGPKINAAGRISTGKTAVDLLLSTAPADIELFLEKIEQFNEERKEKDKSITEEALNTINCDEDLQHKNTTVLYQPDWHKGVIGIVASRLIEKYFRPTVVLTESDNGVLSGSVRSVPGFDVYDALEECQEHLTQFGGHKYAAGLTMKPEQLVDFQNRFEEVVTRRMNTDKFQEEIEVDEHIQLRDISEQLHAFIERLSPFGPHNPTPLFASHGVVDSGKSRTVGADKTHLKLELVSPTDGTIIPGIAFGLGHMLPHIETGQPFDIVYEIDMNHWKQWSNVQLIVKDIKVPHMQ